MSFTAALAAQMLGVGRRLRIALWVWLAVTTVGTVYLGWHYFVDDIAGVRWAPRRSGSRACSPASTSAPRAGCGAQGERGRAVGWHGRPGARGAPVAAGEPSDA